MSAREHRGAEWYRTLVDDESGRTEAAFSEAWEIENDVVFNDRGGLLQMIVADCRKRWILSSSPTEPLTRGTTALLKDTALRPRDKVIAATAIQWLGTNCGWAFLERVLKECGFHIVKESAHQELRVLADKARRLEVALAAVERINLDLREAFEPGCRRLLK